MPDAARVFDALRAWHRSPEAELSAKFNGEAAAVIRDAASLLLNHDVGTVTKANFPALVRQMNELIATGSRELGEAVADSGELADAGKVQEASAVLRAFLATCTSPFYEKIARSRLDKLNEADD
jgi:uncharacterized protein DUF2379